MTITVLFISLLVLLAIGLPIAYSLLGSVIFTVLVVQPGLSIGLVVQTVATANDSFPIMAVPFFILAGLIMGRGGISKRLFDVANSFIGHIKGGPGIAAVVTAMFFSAISGSGPATVAAVGGIMIPEMVRLGYSKRFAAGLIALAGTIGVIIPPSIPLVVYGVVTGTSIGDLFLAGIVPGILIGLILIGWVIVHARRRGIAGSTKLPLKKRFTSLNRSKAALLMPVIILGGIYGGIFTPTEAAVVSVVYAVIVSTFVYREMSPRDYIQTFASATITTGALMFIVAAASIFGRFLTLERAPETISSVLSSVASHPTVLILIVVLFLLILGTFMETIAAVTITSPILVPVLTAAGMDPVHIGVLIVVIMAYGFVTPPLGVNLFVASSVAKIKTQETVTAMLPGFLLLVAFGLVIAFVPALTMMFISE